MSDDSVVVVGVGGGGGKIAERLIEEVPDGPTVAAVNTDSRALDACRATTKLQIGASETRGAGAGGDVSVGRRAAASDMELFRNLFTDVRLAFVVVGLGGGTGTGAAPAVVKAAADAGAATVCFATLPFEFEGRQRREQANEAVVDLVGVADAVIIVPNDRLFGSIHKTGMVEAFGKADEVLATGIAAIWKLVARPGFINLDFADVRRAVRDGGGVCTFGYGTGTGTKRVERSVASLLSSPLLAKGEVIAKARSLLVSILGPEDLALKEVGDIMDAVSSRAGEDTEIFMGTSVEQGRGKRITITVIASEKWQPSSGPPASPVESSGNKPGEKGEREGKSKRRKKVTQTKLKLEISDRGRFKDIDPTYFDGEDLDVPTFLRRGIEVER
ncbi:MAG: hypothetical protein HQ559_16870 [Lentisphaerae bacterium]|nr:hypothetical protein [Lentisphaerota bacterium]